MHISNTATITFNVTSSNTPPVAQNDDYSVVEGQVLTVTRAQGLLANDTDSDGDSISIYFYNRPSHGTAFANADGSFIYTPAAGFYGTDSFTYEATDGLATSDLATVTIAVTPNFGTITVVLSNQPQTSLPFSFTGSLGNFTPGRRQPCQQDVPGGRGHLVRNGITTQAVADGKHQLQRSRRQHCRSDPEQPAGLPRGWREYYLYVHQ